MLLKMKNRKNIVTDNFIYFKHKSILAFFLSLTLRVLCDIKTPKTPIILSVNFTTLNAVNYVIGLDIL